jgi:hypothetical protein
MRGLPWLAPVWIWAGAALAQPIDGIEHSFGATPLIGATGNGRLTAAFATGGELAVLRWPSTTHFEHTHYRTADGADARQQPRLGARENDGGMWGLFVRTEADPPLWTTLLLGPPRR